MKRPSLTKQVVDRLHSYAAYGCSKHKDKAANHNKPRRDRIYSYQTMRVYTDCCVRFARWAKRAHRVKSLDDAKPYVKEYVDMRVAEGKSPYSIRTDLAALAKLYQCGIRDFGVDIPSRHYTKITEHRGADAETAGGHFSPRRHSDLVAFGEGTGLRRRELASLRPEDVTVDGDGVHVLVRHGKGGKVRTVTVLPELSATVIRIAREAQKDGRTLVFPHIPKYAPCHVWRRDFAVTLYLKLARPVSAIPRRERYYCRGECKGQVYDKRALRRVSAALGHNRLNVVVEHYLT